MKCKKLLILLLSAVLIAGPGGFAAAQERKPVQDECTPAVFTAADGEAGEQHEDSAVPQDESVLPQDGEIRASGTCGARQVRLQRAA